MHVILKKNSRLTVNQISSVLSQKILVGFLLCILLASFLIQATVGAEGMIDPSFRAQNGLRWYDGTTGGGASECTQANTSTSSASLDGFLQALAMQESGGDPLAANPTSSARGKYQYVTGTWQSVRGLYKPAEKYATADKAPEEIQDAVVYIEYAKKWKEFDGDPFKLAISHYLPAANSNPELLDSKKYDPTPREYADDVVEKITNGFGSEIELLYEQAPEFDKYLALAVGDDFNSNQSSTVSTSAGCSSEVSEGGLTLDQAKKFMMNYGLDKDGDSTKMIDASPLGSPSLSAPGGRLSNCVALSAFFVNKFSSTQYAGGDGGEVVANLRAEAGAKVGTVPKVFSVFSIPGSPGHTGVVLGIQGDELIVGHASYGNLGTGEGDGTLEGGGAGFVFVGKTDGSTPNPFYLGGEPIFAYLDNVDESKIEGYLNGTI